MSFVQFNRESEALEELLSNGYHMEFALLSIIAKRARWSESKTSNGLQFGEALIGDYSTYGMSRQQYRTAKENLVKLGMITSRPTSKGTVVKLEDSSIYTINSDSANHQPTTS